MVSYEMLQNHKISRGRHYRMLLTNNATCWTFQTNIQELLQDGPIPIVGHNNRFVHLSAFDWEGQRVNLRLLVIGLCSQQIRAGPLSSIQYRQKQFFWGTWIPLLADRRYEVSLTSWWLKRVSSKFNRHSGRFGPNQLFLSIFDRQQTKTQKALSYLHLWPSPLKLYWHRKGKSEDILVSWLLTKKIPL